MKEDILQTIWIYEKWEMGRIKWLFHKYSIILEEQVFTKEIGQQDILYVDEKWDVFHLWHQIYGIHKIVALIAIGKQKRTYGKSIKHEKILNQHQVLRKDSVSVAPYNERFKKHWFDSIQSSHSGWNHLIPLAEALKSVTELSTNDRELRVVLAGIIMTYLSIQWFPLWLVFDEINSGWDDLILKMMDDFSPEKFIADAKNSGYENLVNDIIDNTIFSTTYNLIERIWIQAQLTLSPPQEWDIFDYVHDELDRIQEESLVTKNFINDLSSGIES
jgi:hypothetical protein